MDAVVDHAGRVRARELMVSVLRRAQQRHVIPTGHGVTDYVNTIPTTAEPEFPGDEDIERRIRSYVRWNAAMMVHRAQRPGLGVGGHISTYASTATLYEVGFNHFFRGHDADGGADQIYFQGHASPGIYSRAFLEGRLSAHHLDGFRQEISHAGQGGGLPSYPHPRLMPNFWEFTTVSMGLGPISAIYQARFNRYLHNRGIKDTSRQHVWAFVGDGEMDEPEALGALGVAAREGLDNLDVRRQLQPAAPRRTGPWQRQDHPGAGSLLPRRRLERHQGRLGTRVGPPPGGRPRRGPRRSAQLVPRR